MDDGLNINIIRQTCAAGHIKWTAHILERAQERGIEPTDILSCVNNGRIIEQYPRAYPYPACLILGMAANGIHIHVVVGYGAGFVWIVTAYEPDKNEWTDGFAARKG
ncbi:MAG: DUF4258 domain-containing protein [Oscillospiraceae bacterium]|nr:DUF4258 domain-containing protein [Oscillospiraceae bacterium]